LFELNENRGWAKLTFRARRAYFAFNLFAAVEEESSENSCYELEYRGQVFSFKNLDRFEEHIQNHMRRSEDVFPEVCTMKLLLDEENFKTRELLETYYVLLNDA